MINVHVEDVFDYLLDRAHDAGATVTWGRYSTSSAYWVKVVHNGQPILGSGTTRDMAVRSALGGAFPEVDPKTS